jgi:spore maturation protein SpmB
MLWLELFKDISLPLALGVETGFVNDENVCSFDFWIAAKISGSLDSKKYSFSKLPKMSFTYLK